MTLPKPKTVIAVIVSFWTGAFFGGCFVWDCWKRVVTEYLK